jgi:hypothetical protein
MPAMFSMVALGAFSGAWSLVNKARREQSDDSEQALQDRRTQRLSGILLWFLQAFQLF